MASFQAPSGQLVDVPDNFNPDTGENTTLADVKSKSPELSPVRVMIDQKTNKNVIVPFDKVNEASQFGLIPKEQFDAEQAAKQAKEKVQSGNIGYEPGKGETIASQFAQGALAQGLPLAQGAISAVEAPFKGKNPISEFQNEKEATQSELTAGSKAHPILAGLSNMAGGATSIAATGGANTLAQVVPRAAAYGGLSAGLSDISKDQTSNLGTDVALGTGLGAATGAAGVGVSKLAGKALDYVSPSVQQAFKTGFSSGENLSNPTTGQAIISNTAEIPSKLTKVMENLQKDIGTIKGHSISAIDDLGGVNHSPILDSIKAAEQKLTSLYNETGFSTQKRAFQEAFNALSESEETLSKNLGSAKALDSVKQVLGNDYIFNDNSLVSANPATKNILNDVRSTIQHHLEFNSEKLGGLNVGYKDTLDALNAKGLEKVVPTLSDIESLGSEAPSLSAIHKMNNLKLYNDNIQSNKFIEPEIKSDLNNMINSIEESAKNSKITRMIQGSQTINPLANNAARMKTANLMGSKLGPIYNNLPQNLQQAIQSTPEVANTLTRAIPPSVVPMAQQILQRRQNGQ